MNDTTNLSSIDATGLICPLPLVLLKQAIDRLLAGAVVQIEVTDVHAELDFEIWCERFGHTLEKTQELDGVMVFSVVKGACKTR